jgi:hypothetical protein
MKVCTSQYFLFEQGEKVAGYEMLLPNSGKLRVVGRYTTDCGGCDGIQPYSLIWPRVCEYAKLGHVLFEGALISCSYGNIGRDSEVYGNRMVFAFLDTPLEVCLERVRKRREAKGNFKPLDPKNTLSKFESIQRSIGKIRDEFRRRVVIVDYKKAEQQVMELLNGAS